MPPRSKPKKVGWRREDAALDAMKPFGFPPKIVKQKLKELLNTYGDDGWIAIEEASYQLLIEVILEEIENQEQCKSPTKLITNGDVAESSAGLAALTDGPHNTHLDVADGPNELVKQVSAQSSRVGLSNNENGDQGGTSSKEIIVGDQAQYAGTEHLRIADNVVLVFGASSGAEQANGILETGRQASGVDNPDEAPNVGGGSVSIAADNVGSLIEIDVKTSGFQWAQSIDIPVKCTRKRSYGWYCNSDDEDIVDVTNLTSYKLTDELSGGTKNAKLSRRWDLKAGTL